MVLLEKAGSFPTVLQSGDTVNHLQSSILYHGCMKMQECPGEKCIFLQKEGEWQGGWSIVFEENAREKEINA